MKVLENPHLGTTVNTLPFLLKYSIQSFILLTYKPPSIKVPPDLHIYPQRMKLVTTVELQKEC